MLPLISFETGRKTQTQSSGRLEGLRQQMEVWFFYQEGSAAERPTHAAKNQKEFTPRSSEARQESFCLSLTKTYHGSRVTGKVRTNVHLPLSACAVIGLPAPCAVGEENRDGAVGTLVPFSKRASDVQR